MTRGGAIYHLVVVTALIVAIGFVALHRGFVDPSSLERMLGRFGRLAPILFVLIYARLNRAYFPVFSEPDCARSISAPKRSAIRESPSELASSMPSLNTSTARAMLPLPRKVPALRKMRA